MHTKPQSCLCSLSYFIQSFLQCIQHNISCVFNVSDCVHAYTVCVSASMCLNVSIVWKYVWKRVTLISSSTVKKQAFLICQGYHMACTVFQESATTKQTWPKAKTPEGRIFFRLAGDFAANVFSNFVPLHWNAFHQNGHWTRRWNYSPLCPRQTENNDRPESVIDGLVSLVRLRTTVFVIWKI